MKRETNERLRCRSKFAGCRCMLRSGHRGTHVHDGAAGAIQWGSDVRKQRR